MKALRFSDLDARAPFAFTPANKKAAQSEMAQYPAIHRQSAVLPLLWRAQKQNGGHLTMAAITHVAEMLGMPALRTLEVASFYSMFRFAPVGKYFVQLCGTTSCALRDAGGLKKVCERVIGAPDAMRKDGAFSWTEVECLGACANAPVVQINEDFHEDLTPQDLEELLEALEAGRAPPKVAKVAKPHVATPHVATPQAVKPHA